MTRNPMLSVLAAFGPMVALTMLLLTPAAVSAQADKPNQKPNDKQTEKQPEAIDFERAKSLFQKRERGGKLTADEEAYLQKAIAARRAADGNKPQNGPQRGPAAPPKPNWRAFNR